MEKMAWGIKGTCLQSRYTRGLEHTGSLSLPGHEGQAGYTLAVAELLKLLHPAPQGWGQKPEKNKYW